MNEAVKSTDPAVLNFAIEQAKWLPHGPEKDSSRIADKFAVRAHADVLTEMGRIASLKFRSMNSEFVVAIMDSINHRMRSSAELASLIDYLGKDVSNRVLAVVPEFTFRNANLHLKASEQDKFVVRFPVETRTVLLQTADLNGCSMIEWTIDALHYWINVQRKCHALTTVAAVTVRG